MAKTQLSMDQHFIVLLTYVRPLEDVDIYLQGHRDFLQKYYNSGHLIVSGPQIPRTGGLIMMRAQSLAEVESIMAEDPFTKNEVATIQVIQFRAADFAEDFAKVMA